jgi:hypothetical protein
MAVNQELLLPLLGSGSARGRECNGRVSEVRVRRGNSRRDFKDGAAAITAAASGGATAQPVVIILHRAD